MNIPIEELKYNEPGIEYPDGYRIVCFYKDYYSIGAYCKTIEGFMIGLSEFDPIIDESDIPNFISIDDILNRYLKLLPDTHSVAIYKTDGTCVAKKARTKGKI